MVKKCPVCKKGKFEKVNNITLEIGGCIFVVDGHRCSECGEEFPLEEAAQKTIEVSRRLEEEKKVYKRSKLIVDQVAGSARISDPNIIDQIINEAEFKE